MEDLQKIQDWLGSGSINIFGRPFAGKDTQGKQLAALFDGILLGGGDILRNSTIPDHLHLDLKSGKLIPSDEYVRIVLPYLAQAEFAGHPLVLSSVGRWIGEEEGVISATEAAGHPLKAVVYLDLPEDEVRSRWQALEHHDDRGGRYDDTASILDVRLEEFRTKTLPVIDAYRERGLLIEIDGHASRESVHHTILRSLANLALR